MEEDDDEMRALRASKQFRQHQAAYGNRTAVKQMMERDEELREKQRQEELNMQREASRLERERAIREMQALSGGGAGAGASASDGESKRKVVGPSREDVPVIADDSAEEKQSAPASASAGGGVGSSSASSSASASAPSVTDGDGDAVLEGDSAEDEMLRAMLPTSFGFKKAAVDIKQQHAKQRRADADAVAGAGAGAGAGASESKGETKVTGKRKFDELGLEGDGRGDSDDDEPDFSAGAGAGAGSGSGSGSGGVERSKPAEPLPVTHEVELKAHSRPVCAISCDRKGARVLTGSFDNTVKMWDWGGMNERLQSFRSIEPEEGHPVRYLQYSNTGDQFLVCTGSARPKVYDRDGVELCHLIKGDMYIHDQAHTAGHVMATTSGCWHPVEKHTILTASEDGTLRIWDLNQTKKNKTVIKLRTGTGAARRVAVSACAYSPDASMIVGAGSDGSLQIWNAKAARYQRPEKHVVKAHETDTEITGVTFFSDSNMLLSRGMDDTLRVWDVRKFKDPVKVFEDLECGGSQTDACFSPKGNLFMTSTGADERKGSKGQVVFFDRAKLEKISSVNVADKSVLRAVWQPVINQIMCACADNSTHVLYSPEHSVRGALLSVGKKPRAKDPSDYIEHLDIVNPHALPMYRKERQSKRQKLKELKDKKKAHIPEPPIEGYKGTGGRVQNTRILGFWVSKVIQKKDNQRAEDPREALLKWDERAKSDPMFFGKAYGETQPEAIFKEPTAEDVENEEKRRKVSEVRKS